MATEPKSATFRRGLDITTSTGLRMHSVEHERYFT